MTQMKRVTVRMPEATQSLLESLCAQTKLPAAELLRQALTHYADTTLRDTNLLQRRQITHEFLYLVANKVLSSSSPDVYNNLMAEAGRRAEELYANA